MLSPRGSFQPRDQTCVSCTAGGFFTSETLGKPSAKARVPKLDSMHYKYT